MKQIERSLARWVAEYNNRIKINREAKNTFKSKQNEIPKNTK